jgi:hypothetical protein
MLTQTPRCASDGCTEDAVFTLRGVSYCADHTRARFDAAHVMIDGDAGAVEKCRSNS